MELSSIKHIEPGQIGDYEADLFIGELGFESRSNHVARKFEKHSCRKIILERKDAIKSISYKENLDYLEKQGFEIIRVENDVPDLSGILPSERGDSYNVVVDCTNMSPRWYYEFFRWFDREQGMTDRVRMRIAYTPAGYVRKSGTPRIKNIYNFFKAEVKTAPYRKTALILGLGQEKQVSDSINNMINPDIVYLFYADPPAEKRFVEKVFENNHKLINEIPIRNLIAYPIHNAQTIYQTLINTILPLRNEYSIVLIPHGPKIFSVVAMLVHLGYPDIRISYPLFRKRKVSDRLPLDEPVVLDILFEGEE